MQKRKNSLLNKSTLVLLILTSLFSCTKKDLSIFIKDKACKNIKLSSPQYTWLTDPSCGGGGTTATIEVSFIYDGEERCIDFVELEAEVFRSDNSRITAISNPTQLHKSKSEIQLSGSTVTFQLTITFSSTVDADNLNHILLTWHTENDLGKESKELEVRVNAGCSVVNSSSYTVNSDQVNVPGASSFFDIFLWDDAVEDDDIVSVYLNGEWIIENHVLKNAGTHFSISTTKLNPGANDLVVFAMNEGTQGPNTVAISINGDVIDDFEPGLTTGEAVIINF